MTTVLLDSHVLHWWSAEPERLSPAARAAVADAEEAKPEEPAQVEEAKALAEKYTPQGPGAVFTSPPVSLPAGQFGLGHGSGAHAPNEYYVIESSNPKVEGLVGATMSYVDFLYEIAAMK